MSNKQNDNFEETAQEALQEEEAHQCNFCDSYDTTEYSAEGRGSVWICEECVHIEL